MTAAISLEDREAIYDTLKRYLWCMDTTNIDGVVDTFTLDATVKDVTGKRWDAAAGGARGFAGVRSLLLLLFLGLLVRLFLIVVELPVKC